MFAPPASVLPFRPRAPRSPRAARLGRAALVLAAALAGCLGDAERGNPLDPLSGNFRDAGGVAGVVVRLSAPAEGVAGATVRLTPDGGGAERVTRAEGDGRFSLADVPSGTYRLHVEAAGFAPADTTVVVEVGRLVERTLLLNALPRVTAQRVHTERINRNWPEPFVFNQLVVEAEVSDPDGAGDLTAVLLVVPGLGFRDTLRAVPGNPALFTGTFSEDTLPVSLQNFLGQNLYVEVTDHSGATIRGADAHAIRIVEAVPQFVSPSNQEPAANPPTFVWAPLALPYAFSWRLTISIDVGGREVPVQVVSGLPSSQTSVTLAAPLPPNIYGWTISAVDEHGNLGRSLPTGFLIAAL